MGPDSIPRIQIYMLHFAFCILHVAFCIHMSKNEERRYLLQKSRALFCPRKYRKAMTDKAKSDKAKKQKRPTPDMVSEARARDESECVKPERVLCNEKCPYCSVYNDTRYRYRHMLEKHLLKCVSKKKYDDEQAELADILEKISDPETKQIDGGRVARMILDERKRLREWKEEMQDRECRYESDWYGYESN